MPLDSFEARLTFIELLRRLNASIQSATKCAHFALKYQDMCEDLYSCIIEELEKTSLNARINILFFLETLCDNCMRAGFTDYVDMVNRDLWEILDKVVPPAQGALANVALARQALENFKQKGLINEDRISDTERLLLEREKLVSKDEFQVRRELPSFSKEEILRRMEEDRERHKRMRENIWVIPPGDALQLEFASAWETTSDLDDDDFDLIREERAIFRRSTK
ncbi:CTD kinase subunit gamma CTK3-domain-containing protein [Dipodascopsis uninucleata]